MYEVKTTENYERTDSKQADRMQAANQVARGIPWGTVWWITKTGILTLFLAYFAVPIFVRMNSWILPKIVFSTVVRWPPFINLEKPEDFGLYAARHFYFEVEDGVKLGCWHVLPKSLEAAVQGHKNSEDEFDPHLSSGKPIVLYLHGNSGTRGGWHRVQIYRLFTSLDYHVITFDYRGFGDSTGTPTEDGVVADAYAMFKWIRRKSNGAPLYLWGHSLGTAITTKLAKRLSEENDPPLGIVLESPFNNILDAAANHPFALPFRMLPWFSSVFIDTITEHGISFTTDENIGSVTPPVMILHAEDDRVVPYHLGQKLFEAAKSSRQSHQGEVSFVSFEGHHGYGHKHLFKAPELPKLIKRFFEDCLKRDTDDINQM